MSSVRVPRIFARCIENDSKTGFQINSISIHLRFAAALDVTVLLKQILDDFNHFLVQLFRIRWLSRKVHHEAPKIDLFAIKKAATAFQQCDS